MTSSATTELPTPYLLFVGDIDDPRFVKTAYGLRDWAPDKCVGEIACSDRAVTLGLPRLSPAEAAARGARSLLIGAAQQGGVFPASWLPTMIEALEAGLDIVSGLHTRLTSISSLAERAAALGRRLHDVRVPPRDIPVATGRKRSGKRLLTVGTDCALGKKYTALALTAGFVRRGADTTFRATGQTGIMIAGGGIPMDAVVADFEAGAAEILSPAAAPDHWDIIEGQGSLFHPAYAGVSLGLLHGSQPDVIVMCHEPGRTELAGMPGFAVPQLGEAIDLTVLLGQRTNPAIRCAGVSFNTSRLSEPEAEALIAEWERKLGLPVADPIRGGASFDRLVEACLA